MICEICGRDFSNAPYACNCNKGDIMTMEEYLESLGYKSFSEYMEERREK